ncbi:DUF1090 domain-containing protein [Serratia marcescens]|uniref:DUF1090 domain-containing protein n=1 Tax=Serratia marcescens TaxID=615 RepID=UPI000F7F9AF9|nr:DUF1090 domain-containing protein [Serratia marcescens]RTF43328.1 DUF1090 domain-containing protein [Serratia marcescens]
MSIIKRLCIPGAFFVAQESIIFENKREYWVRLKRTLLIGVITMPMWISSAFADMTGCSEKKTAIRMQIEDSRIHGNTYRISGLEKALSEVNEHCDEHELVQQKRQKVEEKVHKVEQRQREYDAAKRSGQADKIRKKLQKLDEAKEELAEANAALHLLQGEE